MSEGLAHGMLWAAALLVGAPLAIGIGVAVFVLRGRRGSGEESPR